MSTYEIPAAPDVDTVWVTIASGSTIRVCRDGLRWRVPEETVAHTWPELLQLGPVSDVHPDLPADAPLPWRMNHLAEDGSLLDSNGYGVKLRDDDVAAFIVKAANAYGERVAAEDVDPCTLREGGDYKALRAELDAVLGEVRQALAYSYGSGLRSAAESLLRARLERAA